MTTPSPKTQPTSIDLAREARRLAQLRAAAQKPKSDDDPKAAA